MSAPAKITSALAGWAEQKSWASVPSNRRQEALDSVVDTVGVALAGFDEDAPTTVRAYLAASGGAGDAEIWGTGEVAAPAAAAFANGVAAHALDFDDIHHIIHGHPSCVLLPALIALAQQEGMDGTAVLEGYVVGTGVMAAVSTCYGPRHYTDGWHKSSTCGAVGAAAGVAKLLGMPADGIAMAIGAAVSMSGGVRSNFGTMTKPVHIGLAARAGVEAALLVRGGLTSNPGALEDRYGGLDLFGDGSWRPAAGPAGADQLVEIADDGLATKGIKPYPCCGGSHAGIDAALEVRAALPAGAVIESVRVEIPRGGRTALIHDDPATGLEGKFSLPYTVATGLVHGRPTVGHFTDAAVHDPRTREVMARLVVVEDPDSPDTAGSMDERRVRVTVRTVDAGEYTGFVHGARGTHMQPLTPAEVDRKFLDCAGIVLPVERAESLLDRLRHLDERSDLRGLVDGAPVAAGTA